jgi:ParB family transcriptional regulator, chromosome partitioning protein
LGCVLIELTILHAALLHNTAQVPCQAAAVYKVDVDAIGLKVKQEFAAKDRKQPMKEDAVKRQPD